MSKAAANSPRAKIGRESAPKPMRSQSTPRIHDPRERLLCVQLGKLRRKLRLGVDEFARSAGVRSSRLVALECQASAWTETELQRFCPVLSELISVGQNDIDEAAALLAEIGETAGAFPG